jgi:putative phosphoesterase
LRIAACRLSQAEHREAGNPTGRRIDIRYGIGAATDNLQQRPDSMIVGVVSDTHGHVETTRPAVRMLESCEVQLVIHCGDIGTPEIVALFEHWPTHFVFGNVDTPPAHLRQAIKAAGQTCHERFGSLELSDKRIAFLHGDDETRLRTAIASGEYDLVCYGHTHLAEQHHSGKTLVVNPGALYRAQPHSLAIVRLPQLEITHVKL